ncbi:YciI family protein [Amycolatopsis silviterrae]|uniref:YciI family protein n=1 Tax=Amycolatopsis silviterrae TaxID=1656914 RepID=A0ABW5HAP4_9PSEU
MKYLILAYGNQQDYDHLGGKDGAEPAATPAEMAAIDEFLAGFTGALAESGELVDTQGLAAPVLARRLDLRDGAPVVTDGPFGETEEVIAGYWMVDCASIDRATEIAAGLLTAPGRLSEAGVVVRPVMGAESDV